MLVLEVVDVLPADSHTALMRQARASLWCASLARAGGGRRLRMLARILIIDATSCLQDRGSVADAEDWAVTVQH